MIINDLSGAEWGSFYWGVSGLWSWAGSTLVHRQKERISLDNAYRFCAVRVAALAVTSHIICIGSETLHLCVISSRGCASFYSNVRFCVCVCLLCQNDYPFDAQVVCDIVWNDNPFYIRFVHCLWTPPPIASYFWSLNIFLMFWIFVLSQEIRRELRFWFHS